MVVVGSFAAILASLYMLITQGFTVLKARRTGVLVSKSYGAARIERVADPERFDKLLQGRTRALGGPGLILLGGVAVLAWQVLEIALMR